MDLLYSYIPKWVQLVKALRSYDVIKHAGPENCIFFEKYAKTQNFAIKKFWISAFHWVFCLYKRKVVIPTYFVSFSFIVCRYCSKWRIKCPKTEKRRHPPRHPLSLTAYPTPGKVVPPFFSMKMTAKDVKEIAFMPLVAFFSVLERPEKNSKGGCNYPLG